MDDKNARFKLHLIALAVAIYSNRMFPSKLAEIRKRNKLMETQMPFEDR